MNDSFEEAPPGYTGRGYFQMLKREMVIGSVEVLTELSPEGVDVFMRDKFGIQIFMGTVPKVCDSGLRAAAKVFVRFSAGKTARN